LAAKEREPPLSVAIEKNMKGESATHNYYYLVRIIIEPK